MNFQKHNDSSTDRQSQHIETSKNYLIWILQSSNSYLVIKIFVFNYYRLDIQSLVLHVHIIVSTPLLNQI